MVLRARRAAGRECIFAILRIMSVIERVVLILECVVGWKGRYSYQGQ
jgi:hypothetical protein